MSSNNISTIFGNLPTQETFTISSIFTSGLSEFDQTIIFMPIENAITLFGASENDIFLEITTPTATPASWVNDARNLYLFL